MPNVNDDAPIDETRERRALVGAWLLDQIEMQQIDRRALAQVLGVPLDLLLAWTIGSTPMTLDEAFALDRQLGVPAGSTAAAGGYVSFEVEPDLAGEAIFETREYDIDDEMLEDLQAAVDLGIGVRLRNEWRPIATDDDGAVTSELAWVLDLLPRAPMTSTRSLR